MAGRGSWPQGGYKLGDDFRSEPLGRDAEGIKALKREMIYNGYAAGIAADLPFFGGAIDKQTRRFQHDHGLTVDGVIGAKTARVLFQKRIAFLETRYGAPAALVGKIAEHESNDDPVAQGFLNPGDEGMVQIHLSFYPTITVAEAWDPAFALDWCAQRLKSNLDYVGGDTKGAIAAWNVGRHYALEWVQAGHPPSGGPQLGGQDSFTRATNYVNSVLAEP